MTAIQKKPFTVCLSFDVEMCTNFPYWTSVWDHRKGELDDENKTYFRAMNALAREYNAHFQYYLVGASLEQKDIGYLEEAVADGHGIGNHTFSHLNVMAQTMDTIQVSYNKGIHQFPADTPEGVKRMELRRTNKLIKERLGVDCRL